MTALAEAALRFDLSPKEAIALQERLRSRVVTVDRLGKASLVAGVDVGFDPGRNVLRAAIAVLRLPDLALVESALATRPPEFPYVPGLLSFRELPVVIEALKHLRRAPHLLLCDGQGYAHPRRFGIACHLGVAAGIPSIGVAKTRLIGEHGEVPRRRGRWAKLEDGGEVIGAVLRTRPGVNPVFVSIGHRVSLETAIDYVMRCTTRYRLPETTRQAHRLASTRQQS